MKLVLWLSPLVGFIRFRLKLEKRRKEKWQGLEREREEERSVAAKLEYKGALANEIFYVPYDSAHQRRRRSRRENTDLYCLIIYRTLLWVSPINGPRSAPHCGSELSASQDYIWNFGTESCKHFPNIFRIVGITPDKFAELVFTIYLN